MNIITTAQITGTIAIFLLFCIQFYIAIDKTAFHKAGRITLLWTSIYIFFLFFLRLLQLGNIGTTDQLRIISGFSSLIPLLATVMQLFFNKKSGILE